MKDRIRMVRKDTQKNQADFAAWLNIPQSNLASYESGRRNPSDGIVSLIAEKTGCNIEWLKDGIGEPYRSRTKEEELAEFFGRITIAKDNDFRKKLIMTLSRLGEKEWEMMANFVESLANDTADDK